MLQELDQKIQDVLRRIETERKIVEGSKQLRQATNNQDVLRMTNAKIRDAEKSLSYFESTLQELQARKLQLSDPRRSPVTSQSPPIHSSLPPDYDNDPRKSPESSNTTLVADPARRKNYTKLDLIKADTPYTPAKIARMLHQLEFKLQVEMQYRKGIDKMAKLYQVDGDKKSRADAESKRVESEKKIQLLQAALKRYKNLHVLDVADEEEEQVGVSLMIVWLKLASPTYPLVPKHTTKPFLFRSCY
jgi:hypothetical protein